MKRSILRALALCLTTGFVAGYAQANDDKTSSGTSGQSSQSTLQGRTSSISEKGELGTSTGITSGQSGQPVRVSRLMNTSVNGQSGGSLGQVQDVIVDPASGQMQFVVISLSANSAGGPGTSSSTTTGTGIGGTEISSPRSAPSSVGSYGTPIAGKATPMGGKLVAIPWRLMSRGSGDQLMANVDATRLQSAPSFNSTTWPTMDSAWSQRVNSYFGVDASSTGAPGTNAGTDTGTGTGIGNPSTPGLPSTPGTPDISPPTPGTSPSTTPGTPSATGTGTGGVGK